MAIPGINNWDFSILKRVNFTEHQSFEFSVSATNIFNHAQYVPGMSAMLPRLATPAATFATMLEPNTQTFNQPKRCSPTIRAI